MSIDPAEFDRIQVLRDSLLAAETDDNVQIRLYKELAQDLTLTIAALRERAWRPIEEAKEGEWVYGGHYDYTINKNGFWLEYRAFKDFNGDWCTSNGDPCSPDYFTTLPAPPQQEETT